MMNKFLMAARRLARDFLGAAVLLAGTFGAGAAYGADAPAQANAEIVPLASLTRLDDLAFGSVVPGAVGGVVSIDPSNNVRSTTGSVIGVASTYHAARFRAAGGANVLGIVTLPTTATLTRVSGTETMAVANFTIDGATLNLFGQLVVNLGPTGIQEFSVGADLVVVGNQVPGDYQGSFQVTTIYL